MKKLKKVLAVAGEYFAMRGSATPKNLSTTSSKLSGGVFGAGLLYSLPPETTGDWVALIICTLVSAGLFYYREKH